MWPEALGWYHQHRQTLRRAGIDLSTPIEPAAGLLCTWREGRITLSLPDRATPEGRLQAALIGALMGIEPADVERLFRLLLPRLVAHEIGHALRAEAGRLGADVLEEEQAAERLAHILSRPHIDRSSALALLSPVSARLGGLEAAASLHRRAGEAAPALSFTPEERRAAALHLRQTYYRDIRAYLRTSVSWTWLDLALNWEDNLDGFYADHLAPAPRRPALAG